MLWNGEIMCKSDIFVSSDDERIIAMIPRETDGTQERGVCEYLETYISGISAKCSLIHDKVDDFGDMPVAIISRHPDAITFDRDKIQLIIDAFYAGSLHQQNAA